MLLNYLRIAYRNLFRYKAFSLINIMGLAIGLTCCFMILIWVMDELSYEDFHDNPETLYRSVLRYKNENGVTASPWGPTIWETTDFPGSNYDFSAHRFTHSQFSSNQGSYSQSSKIFEI